MSIFSYNETSESVLILLKFLCLGFDLLLRATEEF